MQIRKYCIFAINTTQRFLQVNVTTQDVHTGLETYTLHLGLLTTVIWLQIWVLKIRPSECPYFHLFPSLLCEPEKTPEDLAAKVGTCINGF